MRTTNQQSRIGLWPRNWQNFKICRNSSGIFPLSFFRRRIYKDLSSWCNCDMAATSVPSETWQRFFDWTIYNLESLEIVIQNNNCFLRSICLFTIWLGWVLPNSRFRVGCNIPSRYILCSKRLLRNQDAARQVQVRFDENSYLSRYVLSYNMSTNIIQKSLTNYERYRRTKKGAALQMTNTSDLSLVRDKETTNVVPLNF